MAIERNQLSLKEQLKLSGLSKEDQKKVLNCKDIASARNMLENMNNIVDEVRLNPGNYEPVLQVSGSSVKYRTKNLFTETFDEEDVKDFIALAGMSSMMADEVVKGELQRKIASMQKEGKQPLQCLVYATKQNEKVFYNNEKRVAVWAGVIADTVNQNQVYALSVDHMLVNWGIWKNQISMLIAACGNIKQNERLDEVIRDLYTDSDDDKVRFTVMKILLHGLNRANYQCAFLMLKNTDSSSEMYRKYFNVLKRKVENATENEWKALYDVFRGIQGFPPMKKRKIEALFTERRESGIVMEINESSPENKDYILDMVRSKICGNQKDFREIAVHARNIEKYRPEIQKMFMERLEKTHAESEDMIRMYGLAIGDLDQNDKAVPFLERMMSSYKSYKEKRLMFAYTLALVSNSHIDGFVDNILKYEGGHPVWNFVKMTMGGEKIQTVRQLLYQKCAKLRENAAENSEEFKTALRNIGMFFQSNKNLITAIYDLKFDQMLFDFAGYDKGERVIDESACTPRNVTLVLGILENVMDKNNYAGRYMNFMGDLFTYFRSKNKDIADRIDKSVKNLTGQGIPCFNK